MRTVKIKMLETPTRAIDATAELTNLFAEKLIGQPAAIDAIVPFIQMHRAGLSPWGRPVGVFMLLGPTGTGKTRTVEALAEVLHGNPAKMIKVDCGEFQMEHEVAKLVGAPPGYLGHRETQPMLNQLKINAAASEASDLSIILFDEIEKAAASMSRILLGILDKATLRLGDNNTVDFQKTLIFLTSNLGAQAMQDQLKPGFGFEQFIPRQESDGRGRLQKIGLAAVRRKFTPEFVNRIDSVITYEPLSAESLSAILDQHLIKLRVLLDFRLERRTFVLDVPVRTRKALLALGTSEQYGARELKRTIQRLLVQPLAVLLSNGRIRPGALVRADVNDARTKLVFKIGREIVDNAA